MRAVVSVATVVYFLREGYEVFGADSDPQALEAARRLAVSLCAGAPGRTFRLEALDAMSFPDGFCRCGASGSAVLHFARDDDHFLAMLRGTWRV